MSEPEGEAALDELSRALREELERRDEMILALEMLVVDQASRLLALEALVLEAMLADEVDLSAVELRIAEAAERFRASFERVEGFAERAQRIAGEMIGSAAAPGTKRPVKPSARPKAKAKAKALAKASSKAKAKAKKKGRGR